MIPWRRKWQPTPVLLRRKFHGWRSLVGYRPWGPKESDRTKRLLFPSFTSMVRAPLQGPGALSPATHPALPLGTYPEVQVVCPGADDLVLGRAVTQLVLVDVIAPRCISVLIESHRVPRNAWGAMGVTHSVSLLSLCPESGRSVSPGQQHLCMEHLRGVLLPGSIRRGSPTPTPWGPGTPSPGLSGAPT